MSENLLFSQFLIEVLAGVIFAAVTAVGFFITALWKCVKNQDQRTQRQSKAILSLVRFISYQKERLHPDEKFPDIVAEIEDELKDSKGNY